MSHWIHPEAEAELEEASLHLAEHASPALAEALLLEYKRVVALSVENQQRGPHTDFGMRMYHLNRFRTRCSTKRTPRSAHRSTR